MRGIAAAPGECSHPTHISNPGSGGGSTPTTERKENDPKPAAESIRKFTKIYPYQRGGTVIIALLNVYPVRR